MKKAFSQEELRKISEAFKIVFDKTLNYPDDYPKYEVVGWQNKDGSFGFGSYRDIGFNPKIHYKEVIKRKQEELKAIKIGYEKWEKEFNNKV